MPGTRDFQDEFDLPSAGPHLGGQREFRYGIVDFIVIRELRGMQFQVKCSGGLEGDTLTGTIDRPIPGGER